MDKQISLFPLNLVVFPEEELNLHIFEPRYKQLINDCLKTKKTFGIPSYVTNKIEYGAEMKISEVTKVYDDGRMDVKTNSLGLFQVKEYHNPWKDKLYAGGMVRPLEFYQNHNPDLHIQVIDGMKELFQWLKTDQDGNVGYHDSMYKWIHKIGLKKEEEYLLLKMEDENSRQQYVLDHLEKLIPMLERAEAARERIKMNGHFKHLDPLKF